MSALPSGWVQTKLSQIIRLHDSKRVPLNALQRATMKGVYAYYGANGLVDHVNDYIFDGNFILLAEDGGYFDNPSRNVAYEASGKFWVNNHAHILATLGGIQHRYLVNQLNSINWLPYVGGSTRLKLTQGGLEKVEISLPPLAEQKRIVAKIDSLTAKSKRARDHLNHIPRLVEKYKQAILSAAFDGSLTMVWRNTQRSVPAWSKLTLEDIIDEGPSNGWSPPSGEDAKGALTLKLTATTSGKLRLDAGSTKRIYEVPGENSKFWLRSGDLLVQRANALEHVGASAIFEGPSNTYIYPDLMMRVRINNSVDRIYLWRFLGSKSARTYFKENATGTAGNMPKISGDTLRKLTVPYPNSFEEREEIVRRISSAFTWIDRLAAEATSARKLIDKLDQAVLSKAFRGELVPQDPNDEPASVLLERIHTQQAGASTPRRGRRKVAEPIGA